MDGWDIGRRRHDCKANKRGIRDSIKLPSYIPLICTHMEVLNKKEQGGKAIKDLLQLGSLRYLLLKQK